jgi:hypothetical protein
VLSGRAGVGQDPAPLLRTILLLFMKLYPSLSCPTARDLASRFFLFLFLVSMLSAPPLLQAKSSENILGPTGMFAAKGQKELKVTRVVEGSPADGVVAVGDIIVAANGNPFKNDARRELADAINEAETEKRKGQLELTLKGGKTVELELEVRGNFSDTAPYDCPKTDALVTALAGELVESGDYTKCRLGVSWLGLMATGEEKYLKVVKDELPDQPWANPDRDDLMAIVNGEKDSGLVSWHWGYGLLTLSEYHLLTGDRSVLPAIETYALALSRGQDPAGTWGHRMISPERGGRLPGYAHINQPSLACFIGLILAKKCGIEAPELDQAIAQCHAFFRTYIGKGTIPYGVHDPNSREFNNNGMSGMAAIAMALLGDDEGAEFFSRQVATDSDRLETGHANYFFNVMWSPLGAHVAGPEVTQEYAKRSRWLYTLYRAFDDKFTYNGSWNKGGDPSGALLLNYCTPRQQLFITGKEANESYWLTGKRVQEALDYSQINYDQLSGKEMLAMFDHEAPQVRRRVTWFLRDKADGLLGEIEKLLTEGSDLQQISALGFFGYKCPPEFAEPRLKLMEKILADGDENSEVRAMAASALSHHPPQSHAAYPSMLEFLLEERADDPFQLIDKEVGRALVTISQDPFTDGLVTDKDLFYRAVERLAHNPRQEARGAAMKLLAHMPAEDFPRVAELVKYVSLNRDPSHHSYHNPQSTLLPGGQLLARLGIRDGMEWAVDVMETKDGKHGFKVRATAGVLNAYGAHAREIVKEIEKDENFTNP